MKQKTIGLLLIFLSLGALGFWEFWGRENLSYESVVVFRSDVGRGTEVEKQMLEVRKMDKPGENVLLETDMQKIIGQETVQFIPAGAPLHGEYFQNPELAIGGDSGRFILSIPNQWLMSFPQTMRRGDEVSFYCGGKLVVTAPVAYVRDSSNQEVTSADEDRLQASAPVSLVEIVVDEEKALKLGRLADEGKQFVLLYS